jgi:DNA (cytosine-5)-methyltransferase 1
MNYLSVCSGIEAATCAWHDLGWNPVGFSEIEPFPSAVLKHHYPTVPNLGDMTKYKEWNLDSVNLLVGGTPCQSFSVAGLRKGLDDPRGNLALTYVGILDKFKPKWCVWENVPGVLSSNGGRDFGSFLGALAELGYGFAYRVLDAQNFGVPQRRRRVFVVGCLGDWESAAKVLFESDCLSGDNKKSRTKRQATATYSERGIAYGGSDGECADTVTSKWAKGSGGPSGNECGLFVAHKVYETHPADSRVKEMGEVCQTVTSRWGTGGGNVPLVQSFDSYNLSVGTINQTIKSPNGGVLESVGGVIQAYSIREDAKANNFSATPLSVTPALQAMQPSVQSHHAQTFVVDRAAFNQGANALYEPRIEESEVMPTLVSKGPHAIMNHMAVRRLTPRECERLQGFKDDYTVIPWKKGESPDGHRYKALGNSMAVPVMKWIGERINEINK